MKQMSKFMVGVLALAGMAAATAPANAQSTEEVLGAAIGGSLGAVIGGELDKKGSRQEGEIIGAVVGGTLGYAIGDSIDDRNDRDRYYRDRRYQRAYTDGRYRSPYSDRYGYPQPVYGYGQPYYGPRKKAHPVFAEHPGRGRGHGLYKRR